MRDNEYQRRYTDAKKAAGLCIACGCKRKHAPERTLCQPCLDRMNKRAKERCAERKAAGICRQCGTRPLYSEVFCIVCLEAQKRSSHPNAISRRNLPNKAIRALREYRQQESDDELLASQAKAQELGMKLIDEMEIIARKGYMGRHPDTMRKLNIREKDMIIQRYGLDGYPPKTLEEVAVIYDLTRERVRQVIKPFEAVARQIGLLKAVSVPKRLRR